MKRTFTLALPAKSFAAVSIRRFDGHAQYQLGSLTTSIVIVGVEHLRPAEMVCLTRVLKSSSSIGLTLNAPWLSMLEAILPEQGRVSGRLLFGRRSFQTKQSSGSGQSQSCPRVSKAYSYRYK